jgi:cobalt-zinc-cadmium efflux system outer membrane protein
VIRHFIVLVTLSVCIGVESLGAQSRSVTLDEALRLFASNSLELRLSRSDAASAAGRARQAGAFPNPSLNASHEPLRGGGTSYSETYLTMSQRFEVGGSRGARSAAGERRFEVAVMQLRADSMRLATEVKRTFVETVRAQDMLEVTDRIAGVFRAAASRAEERYESGDISLYATRRIAVERARYETLLAEAELEVDEQQSALALLISPEGTDSRIAATSLPAPVPPEQSLDLATLAFVERRAELAAAEASVEAESAEARLSRSERIPDITATGGLKRQSDGLRGAILGLSVPLPVFDRGGGAVAAADAGTQAARERLALTRRQLENDVIHAIDTYASVRRRADLLLGADNVGGDLLEIALIAYDEGEMELVELLDAADAMHEARRAETALGASLWIAYFDLERAVGGFDSAPGAEVEQ